MVTGVRSAAIPGCDPGVPGLRMRRTAGGRGRAGTGQGACVAAPGSHWLPRAGGRGLQRGASSARTSASQPGSWSPRRGVGVLAGGRAEPELGVGVQAAAGAEAAGTASLRGESAATPAPAPTPTPPPPRGRAVPSLPGLRASRASIRCCPPGPDPPPAPTWRWLRTRVRTPLLCAQRLQPPVFTVADPPGIPSFLSESPTRTPVIARSLSLRRWTEQTAVPGPAPPSGPIEAVCPPWEPEVGSCPHLPAVPF